MAVHEMRSPRAAGAVAAIVFAILAVAACDSGDVGQPQPVANPQVVCVGVPNQPCRQAFDITGEVPGRVAQVVVQCTAPVCTIQNGEADVTVVFIDGHRESSGYGWAGAGAGAAPAPIPVKPPVPLAITPVCLGVPRPQCLDMAATGPEGEGVGPEVASITVRCSDVCTDGGSGQTTYEFKDGRPSVTIMWANASGG
jgi:hypothetical protein